MTPFRRDPNKTSVVSFGGVGSKMLLRFLRPGATSNDLNAHHLHTRKARQFLGQDKEFVYVFGDPRNAVVSFFNRRIERHDRHGFKDGINKQGRLPEPGWVGKHADNLGISQSAIPADWDLEDFLNNSRTDPLELANHFGRWFRNAGDDRLTVTFMRYETLWQHEPLLQEIFGLAEAKLPPQMPRAADWAAHPSHIQKRLNELYGPLVDHFAEFPDIFECATGRITKTPIKGPRTIMVGARAGMFAIVNVVINLLNRHEKGEFEEFRLDDKRFLFGQWEDYFKPLFGPIAGGQPDVMRAYAWEFVQPRRVLSEEEVGDLPGGKGFRQTAGSILLPPADRHAAHRLIKKYIHLADPLAAEVQREIDSSGIKDALALHIRGAGRDHGGVDWMLRKMGYKGVPYDVYFREVDAYLKQHDVPIFVFSDAREVIDKVVQQYGDRVQVRQQSLLTATGEGHLDENVADKAQMGRDVVTECYMMANARFLIHGNSNVTNFAQCLNAELAHMDIYQPFYQQ